MPRDLPLLRPAIVTNSSTRSRGSLALPVSLVNAARSASVNGSPIAATSNARQVIQESPRRIPLAKTLPKSALSLSALRIVIDVGAAVALAAAFRGLLACFGDASVIPPPHLARRGRTGLEAAPRCRWLGSFASDADRELALQAPTQTCFPRLGRAQFDVVIPSARRAHGQFCLAGACASFHVSPCAAGYDFPNGGSVNFEHPREFARAQVAGEPQNVRDVGRREF